MFQAMSRSLRPYIELERSVYSARARIQEQLRNYDARGPLQNGLYIGQEAGRLYDMERPHEFDNLWDRIEYAQCKETMLRQCYRGWLRAPTAMRAISMERRRYSMCWPRKIHF